MDDFGMLARDFGFRPQGKSAPMRSDGTRPPSSSATVTEDNQILSDVFGGPPKHTNNSKSTSAMTDFDYDVIFKNSASMNNDEAKSKATFVNLPVYDKPVYDVDIFDELPGLKSKSMSSSASSRYKENTFASMTTSPPKRNQRSDNLDDLMGNLSRAQKVESTKQNRSKSPSGFDDLISGFGSGRPATSNSHRSSWKSTPKSTANIKETSNTVHNPHQSFSTDGLEEISNVPLNGFGKSAPAFTSKDSTQKASFRETRSHLESHPTKFIPPRNHDRSFDQSTSPASYIKASSRTGMSHMSENVQLADHIWLTVSEIPLFTPPTRAPPPSRPPPPIPRRISNSRNVGNSFSSPNSRKYPQSPRPFQATATSPLSGEEMDSTLAAAAMKEAMDRAEAKFRHAKEVREREHTKASRNKDEEREKGKQAVERATREARLKTERAAVQRAQAEARERAAVGAERAATEAREKEKAAASRINQQKNDDSAGGVRKSSVSTSIVDDLSSIFGGGQFQQVEGETEERRRARLEREQRTQERAAKALAEKNQRDLQSQREQEERNRIGGTLDTEIKRWAAGKEGNLRALLSTLQYVLWPECGWQPVSLTDLINGANVKKAYRKATLCIHPDKVQQKGATLQQKYVAEKVFDILKEAWNKFNSEELF